MSSKQWKLLCGKAAILAMKAELQDLAGRSELSGAMDFLDFFLSAPYFGLDVPHATLRGLKLLPKAALTRRAKLPRVLLRCSNGQPDAAVFVFEYALHGISTGCYIPADSDGYRTVIAPLDQREEVAMEAAGVLLRRGALLLLLSYMQPAVETNLSEPAHTEITSRLERHADRRLLATQVRGVGRRLPLQESFEATLESLSRNTRHNLRRSMHGVLEELGATFHAAAEISLPDLQELASQSAYGPPDWAVQERFRAVRELPGGVLAGLRGQNGQWVSVAGGHRELNTLCLDWQLNRSGLGALSVATAMRGYLMESEIKRQTAWLRFESGTTHPLQRAFVRERTHDLLFARRLLPVGLLKRLAAGMAEGGPLATVLGSESLIWQS